MEFRVKDGFTLIEVLIVIALVGVIAAMTVIGFLSFSRYQQYELAAQEVYESTREARVRTLASDGDTNYGVHYGTSSVTVFTGDTYTYGAADNDVRTITGATISTELSGGVDDVVFTRLNGLPSASGNLVVTADDGEASTTISISGGGLIE